MNIPKTASLKGAVFLHWRNDLQTTNTIDAFNICRNESSLQLIYDPNRFSQNLIISVCSEDDWLRIPWRE